MLKLFPTATVGFAETQCGGENRSTALPSLHRAGGETSTVADSLDVVDDGDFRVAGQNEIAMHAVDGKIIGDSSHRGGKRLGDGGTAVNASCARRMPKRPGVCEYILVGLGGIRISPSNEESKRERSKCHTLPTSTTGVNSKTFSIGAFEGSSGGGSNKVTDLAIVGIHSP